MGLISFLKSKFGKKPKEQASSLPEEKPDQNYVDGLEKSRKNFADKLKNLARKYKTVNKEYFDELEQVLIEADVGVNLTIKVIDEVLSASKTEGVSDAESINELLVDKLFLNYAKSGGNIINELAFQEGQTTVVLVVGVNGVGKTTTIAKLAYKYKEKGKKILLGACDTFRAGAVEQLSLWAERLGVEIVKGSANEDPASVAYRSAQKANEIKADLLIVDTAGRLQNKVNLMAELEKIYRVLGKAVPGAPHESLLIIDATTGQNGVVQAKVFNEVAKLTGVIITKMDGTSKGGIILAIRDELGLPVRYIGLGEKMSDLQEFDLDKYLYSLCLESEEVHE